MSLATHILFGLQLDSFKIFWNAFVAVIPFLSFKGITHAYLLKISITQNKNWILKELLIGYCNSSANSLFDIFSFLTAP